MEDVGVDLDVEAWWLVEPLYRWDDWVHRRVETIEFVSFRTVRRHTSVDLTIPTLSDELLAGMRARRGGLIVPLTLIGKTPGVLQHFDSYRPDGGPLPILTKRDGQELTTAVFHQVFRTTQMGAPITPEAEALIDALLTEVDEAQAQASSVQLLNLASESAISDAIRATGRRFVTAAERAQSDLRELRSSGSSGLRVTLADLEHVMGLMSSAHTVTGLLERHEFDAATITVERSLDAVRTLRKGLHSGRNAKLGDIATRIDHAAADLTTAITAWFARQWLAVLGNYFARCYALYAIVDAQPRERIVLKYEFDNEAERRSFRWGDLPVLVGLSSTRVGFLVPQAQLASAYHAEIPVAEGIHIADARFEDGAGGIVPSVQASRPCAERAHLYVNREGAIAVQRAVLTLTLSPSVLMTTLLLAALTFAVLIGGLAAHLVGDHSDEGGATTLILAAPAIFVAIVFPPGQHASVRWLIRSWRGVAIALIGASLFAAAFLSVEPRPPIVLWVIPMFVSGLCLVFTAIGWIRAMVIAGSDPRGAGA